MPNDFYKDGLKFSCKRCSTCCRVTSGYVYLSQKDISNLVLALNVDRNSFLQIYCRWVINWKGEEVLSLKEKSNKDCILWDNGCTVYSSRPLQCLAFPFWDSIIASEHNWEIAAGECPGMNTGELHLKMEIEKFIKLRECEPIINRVIGSDL